jgi:hypothetical protein
LGNIVGVFKSLCVHHCLQWIKNNEPNRVLGKIWQRNYYEHIIRHDESLNKIREYIRNNPANWSNDKNNPLQQSAKNEIEIVERAGEK